MLLSFSVCWYIVLLACVFCMLFYGKMNNKLSWLCFYQTRSAWSMDQGSTKKYSAVHNVAPTVTKFCVMWEGLSLPHDTKFGNCRGAIVDRRVIFIWSLIHGSSWSGLIKAEPGTNIWMSINRTCIHHSCSEKACSCDLNGITQRGRLVYGYIIRSPSGRAIIYPRVV